jgi:hypothetical protein
MNIIARFLERVNKESGKTENRFSLEVLEKKLSSKKGNNRDIVSYCDNVYKQKLNIEIIFM